MYKLKLLVAILIFSGCSNHDEPAQSGVKSLSWLEGTWVAEDSTGQFVEEWHNAGLIMTGHGKMIRGNDTTQMERLSIVSDTSRIYYIVDFPNREVRFASRSQTMTKAYKNLKYNESTIITFVNDTNDFPREIVYRKQNSDSLYITLTGTEAGKPMEMTLKMKKAK